MGNEVLLAVDPHKHSMTVAVFDVATQVVIEQARQPNNRDGYRELLRLAKRFKQRRWAVEGSQGAGRSMAQRLVADREQVVDVPAKLAARVRVYSQGHGRKTDDHDAASIGLAALNSNRLNTVEVDSVAVTLRLIADRRKELVALRTQAICRLHRLFTDLPPGGAKRFLSAKQAGELLAKIRWDWRVQIGMASHVVGLQSFLMPALSSRRPEKGEGRAAGGRRTPAGSPKNHAGPRWAGDDGRSRSPHQGRPARNRK